MQARPTTYKGIQMRSRLEARYAAWLDGIEADWQYEPQCFADDTFGQYLPDFVVRDVHVVGRRRSVYVEVKPLRLTKERAADLMFRQSAIWSSEPESAIVIDIAERPLALLRLNWRSGDGIYEACWVRREDGSLSIEIPTIRRWTTHA